MKKPLDEKAVVEIVRRELAELALEQQRICTRHWKEGLPLALTIRETFSQLSIIAMTRWGRNAKLKKWNNL